MHTGSTHERPSTDGFAPYPALGRLRLAPEDLAELARQGFVTAERRGNSTYHKLRFRRGGRQVVRYVGSASEAAAIASELEQLQARQRLERELKTLDRLAHRVLRESKARVEPLLAGHGLKFHGRAIRRPRPSRNPSHGLSGNVSTTRRLYDESISHTGI